MKQITHPLLCIIITLLSCSCSNTKNKTSSSNDILHTEVLNTIIQFHNGMRERNGDLAIKSWHEHASSYNITIDKNNNSKKTVDSPPVNLENIKQWLNTTKDDLDEKIYNTKVFVDGDLAMAWVPYDFYRNNKLSHTGTNAFTLIKIDSKWKIVSVSDTRYMK